jgi:hypothetical protein
MGVWKQFVSQIKQEPLEIAQTAIAQVNGSGTNEQGSAGSSDPIGQSQPLLSNQGDVDRYTQLKAREDEINLKQIRSRLHGEFGLETNIDQGMQRARVEYQQKEQERNKVEEKKKEQEEWVIEKKKQEDFAVVAAKSQASGEKQAWGAG